MLPAFDTVEAALVGGWLLVGSFLVRLGWSTGGWVRRQLLKDSTGGARADRRFPKPAAPGGPTSEDAHPSPAEG